MRGRPARGGGRRHRGREIALRVLFELEGSEKDALEAVDYQCDDMGAAEDVGEFARTLVRGVQASLERIDSAIAEASTNWDLDSLGKVERAVLRLGVYELLCAPGTPAPVVIDESVELAKAYAGQDAAGFVNGVLGHVARGVTGGWAEPPVAIREGGSPP